MTAAQTALAPRKQLVKIKPETEYFTHQVVGARHLASINSWLLGDDMGLGKTLSALTVAAIDFEMGYASRILYITLASLKRNVVESDIDQWTNFTSTILQGTPTKRAAIIEAYRTNPTDILVVSYEQVVSGWEMLNELDFDIIMVDEAHYIKNPKSKRCKAVQKLRAKRYFLMTGSPMQNRPDELWALLHRMDPEAYPKYWAFTQRYCAYAGWQGKQVVGVKNERELNERLRVHMLRRRKADCLDLPPVRVMPILLDLLPDQRKLYKQAVDELKIDLPGDPTGMELENGMTKFLRLKQICGTTACIPTYPDVSCKLDRAEEMIEELLSNGEHVVVWTQFRDVLECMYQRLLKRQLSSYQLHGGVKIESRQDVLGAWGKGPAAALLSMFQVGGVGMNMTSASNVIFLDKLYVPAMNSQAIDRCQRIGQTKQVQVWELIARHTIEQRIERILKTKTAMVDSVVETSDWKRKLYEAVLAEGDSDG
jgi:SNF2 family DNA or RNA helicase